MKWNDDYQIGIVSIDSQHKELFYVLDRLKEAIHTKNIKDSFCNTLKAMVEYTKYHFSDEENILESMGYPEIEDQKVMHKELLLDVRKILTRLKNGNSINPIEVYRFLNDWIAKHILNEDLKIKRFVSQQQKKSNYSDNSLKKLEIAQSTISAKLRLLEKLHNQELITKEKYYIKKVEIFDKNIDKKILIMPEGLQDLFVFVEKIYKEKLLNEEEVKNVKQVLFNKCQLSELLQHLNEIEDKLHLIKLLYKENLLTQEEYNKFNSEIMEYI